MEEECGARFQNDKASPQMINGFGEGSGEAEGSVCVWKRGGQGGWEDGRRRRAVIEVRAVDGPRRSPTRATPTSKSCDQTSLGRMRRKVKTLNLA